MRNRRARLVLAISAVSLLATACGARLDPHLRQAAADAQLKQGSAVVSSGTDAGATTTTNGGGSTTVTNNGGGSTTTNGGGSTTTGGGGPTTTNGGGQTQAPGSGGTTVDYHSAPAGGNGGATDTGVSATTITAGNIADQSGPVPGLFQSAAYGAQAYFAMINSQGGIYGRQLKLIAGDSQTDCAQTQNAVRSIEPKVLAFVGSFGLYDDCASSEYSKHKNLADIGYALAAAHRTADGNFSPAPSPLGYTNGMFKYWAKKYPQQVLKVGAIYPNVPSAALSYRYFRATGESVGWKYAYAAATGATQTTFQAELQQAKRAGVQLMFIAAENAGNTAEIKKEMDQQNFKALFISPVAYASDFIQRLGSSSEAEGIEGANLYSLFFNADEAGRIPEVATFQKWMKQIHPNDALELYAMYSWASAKMYVDALIKIGPKLTRAALYSTLKGVHDFDDNGFVVKTDPGAKKPGVCYVLWKIHNGQYVRQDTPPTQYRCDGEYFYYKGN